MTVKAEQKKFIGKSVRPPPFEVEKGQIRRFAAAIGETNPIHFDEAAAHEASLRTIVAPPTFPGALVSPSLFLDALGWDPQAVMHRAEEYEYFQPETIRSRPERTAIRSICTIAFPISTSSPVTEARSFLWSSKHVLPTSVIGRCSRGGVSSSSS